MAARKQLLAAFSGSSTIFRSSSGTNCGWWRRRSPSVTRIMIAMNENIAQKEQHENEQQQARELPFWGR
jgi:hypothetical protein